MLEGDAYPELRRMVQEPARMQLRQQIGPDWNHPDVMANWRHNSETITAVDAIRITIPLEDWQRLLSIYTGHYHAASRNPAVRDAWQQYKMLVALTEP